MRTDTVIEQDDAVITIALIAAILANESDKSYLRNPDYAPRTIKALVTSAARIVGAANELVRQVNEAEP